MASNRSIAPFRVAEALQAIDPGVARTVANATFMARIPHKKAMEHVKLIFNTFKSEVLCLQAFTAVGLV
jgi:hypothetical protein